MEEGGFEPPKAYAGRFTVCSLWPLGYSSSNPGAGDGTRTRNLLITNQLLCQLSYASPIRENFYQIFPLNATINFFIFILSYFLTLKKGVTRHISKLLYTFMIILVGWFLYLLIFVSSVSERSSSVK